MKYKVGDEVLVKAKIHYVVNQETEMHYGVKERNNKNNAPRTIWVKEEDIQPEPTMTAEEAWEIVRKIIYDVDDDGMTLNELKSVFGTSDYKEILRSYSPQQAKVKIEAWEAEKAIKIGDEVSLKSDPDNDDYKFIVTYIDNDENMIGGFSGFDGGVFSERDIRIYQKTGRHIDIEGLLRNIGGDE